MHWCSIWLQVFTSNISMFSMFLWYMYGVIHHIAKCIKVVYLIYLFLYLKYTPAEVHIILYNKNTKVN